MGVHLVDCGQIHVLSAAMHMVVFFERNDFLKGFEGLAANFAERLETPLEIERDLVCIFKSFEGTEQLNQTPNLSFKGGLRLFKLIESDETPGVFVF